MRLHHPPCGECTTSTPDAHTESRCGFATEFATFDPDNWNCRLLIRLRDAAEALGQVVYGEDYTCAVLWTGDESNDFVALRWYKRRGRTEFGCVVGTDGVYPLTRPVAEQALTTARWLYKQQRRQ